MSSVTPKNPIRFITATSLFDGHDVSINLIRRILQSLGVEVIHLGHNRSCEEIVNAAIQEDVHAIAVSSYQGGHLEFFKYLIARLQGKNARHIKVFGGGGGVIIPDEIAELQKYGVEHIYSPEEGQVMGLVGMVRDMVIRSDFALPTTLVDCDSLKQGEPSVWARTLTAIENHTLAPNLLQAIKQHAKEMETPVLGLTGTGGAGKSSVCDELIRCFRKDNSELKIAVIALDPTKLKTGGALLGDRIRMNTLSWPGTVMRSMATRASHQEVTECLSDLISATKVAGFELIMVETPGIGQADAAIRKFVDLSLYVMTPEYGAPSQLEKINMLDFADIIAINKFERMGAKDALRDVRKQYQRNWELFEHPLVQMPVYGTVASRFNDLGILALYHGILERLNQKKRRWQTKIPLPKERYSENVTPFIPGKRQRYCAEVAETVRSHHRFVYEQAALARELQQLRKASALLQTEGKPTADIDRLIADRQGKQNPDCRAVLEEWPLIKERYQKEILITPVRNKSVKTVLKTHSLSGLAIPKIALPRYEDHGELLKWLLKENLPGCFPFTAGVFHFKRQDEDPTRMFAGEGGPARTNRRFKLLSKAHPAKRLSTAFDSVTLYGQDPNERPDIFGKIGNAGVSIATLDDMKVLFEGFHLVDPNTSVSMTINGPAPTLLAMFLNTAIDQGRDAFKQKEGRPPTSLEEEHIKGTTLRNVRGTVQADILKEDQGQNTCIFSTEFSMKLMGDVQEYFIQHAIKNFYSVSISGYHIAEAGANPISQLAFTLANAFTYVETYLARGMQIDDFAPNFSFFFSNGMDPEYSVMGRVARRIWAITLRDKYGANERSQKLKYHVQTSGRSLHAQEMQFNDIRTTLEALIALYDNCNSLHTNAYDEAMTTPTDESVRRALAIQKIINEEWGLSHNQNPNQGSFIIEELTDGVEEAVLQELESLNERGGVLGAMESAYQRSKIQEESLHYETLKHSGALPIIGVNTFKSTESLTANKPVHLSRSTDEEKQSQLERLRAFHARQCKISKQWLEKLQEAARHNQNVFTVLMEAVRFCSLGEITQALFEVGGQYRRNL